MVLAPPDRFAPLLHWTSTGPPTHNRIKAGLDVRGQGRMILSSTLDHAITTHSHILVFPADRPGMPLFVLVFFFLFLGSPECQITQYARETLDFTIALCVCLFASQKTAVVSSTRAKDGPKIALWLKWSGSFRAISCYIGSASCISHTLSLSSVLNWINVVLFCNAIVSQEC